jgi:hypothetical protein
MSCSVGSSTFMLTDTIAFVRGEVPITRVGLGGPFALFCREENVSPITVVRADEYTASLPETSSAAINSSSGWNAHRDDARAAVGLLKAASDVFFTLSRCASSSVTGDFFHRSP